MVYPRSTTESPLGSHNRNQIPGCNDTRAGQFGRGETDAPEPRPRLLHVQDRQPDVGARSNDNAARFNRNPTLASGKVRLPNYWHSGTVLHSTGSEPAQAYWCRGNNVSDGCGTNLSRLADPGRNLAQP